MKFNEEFAIDGGDMYESIVLKDKKINGFNITEIMKDNRFKNFVKDMKG